MKMKNLLLLPLVLLSLTACNSNANSSSSIGGSSPTSNPSNSSSSSSNSSPSDPSSGSSSTSTSPTTPPIIDGKVETYQHVFNQSDFSGSGYDTTSGTTDNINGLSWSYDAFSFLGQSSDGIQIGSNKAPQTQPWTLSTSFGEEVYLNSFTVSIKATGASGADYVISGGNYTYTENVKNSVVEEYSQSGLNEPMETLTFSLSSQVKAVYFYAIAFSVTVPFTSNLDLTTDAGDVTPSVPGEGLIPETNYTAISKEEYYKNIDFESDVETLTTDLSTLISQMTKISYGDDTYVMLYTDESVSNPGYLYGFYDGDLIKADANGTWNKEHVWACSQMKLDGKDPRPSSDTKNHATDLHNLRVTCQNSNGLHGNKFYDDTNTDITFFPNLADDGNISHDYQGDHRGDVARILFYMALRYDFLELNDDLDTSNDTSMGKLSVLLKWHEEDPVDEFEIQRNNRIYEYQGNRNPFIDYANLATLIYA